MASTLKLGVMGAGSIGCYVGGQLAAAGVDVVFVGRERVRAELAAHGLTVVSLDGRTRRVPPGGVVCSSDPAALAGRDVTLCCVKSAQSAEAGAQLAGVLAAGSLVVSLQNGIGNADVLRAHAPEQTVLGGIVGFNVLSPGKGLFRRATSGPLVLEASRERRAVKLSALLSECGFEVHEEADLRPVQWSKLVMNLNNAVSALSGVPTAELLLSPGYRRVLRGLMAEALAVMARAGVKPARLGALPVQLFPPILALPTALLRVVARVQLKVDPEARSSMWEDLEKRRLTEVDYLNGEVVKLAASCGTSAPLNERIVSLVHEVEARGEGSPKLSADALWAALSSARGAQSTADM